LNIEDSIRRIPLTEDPFLSRNREALPALANCGEEAVGIECAFSPGCRGRTHLV
jgi:hypothetical protein